MEEITGKVDKLRQILRKERERKRLSQAKIAERMGISKCYLTQYEKGSRNLRIDRFLSWCDALHKSPELIFEKWIPSIKKRKKRKRKKPSPEARCIDCKTAEMKLFAKVFCSDCYNKYMETRQKEHAKVPGMGGWLIPEPTKEPVIRSSRMLTREYLVEQYVSKRRSITEIAVHCNCTPETVRKKISYYNIRLRDKFSEMLTKKYLLGEYLSKNKSVKDIAKDCHCSPHTIYKKLASYNIPLRDSASERRTKYNEEFFTSWSPKMAYVLGVIYTDGCLYPGRSKDPVGKAVVSYCRISQRDPELLTKILNLMGSKARIYFAKQRQKGEIVGGIYSILIYNEKIYDDLIGLGLTPRKSLTMKFPEVPPEYMRHFIRGCWDGDGSVFLSADGSLGASFVSGSQDFIEGFIQELYKAGICKEAFRNGIGPTTEGIEGKYPLVHHVRGKAHQIKVTSKKSLENLFHYLYDGVDESSYLKRKHETFLRGLATMPKERSYKRYSKSLESPCTVMRSERKRKGLSQEKVAEAMGISAALLCRLEADKVSLSWAVWIRWCSALRISPSYVIERWQQVGGFAEIASWQQMNNFAQGMATENSEQLEEAFEGKVQPTEKSLTIPKPVKKKLFEEEEFTVRAIKKLRKKPYKGIHTVYSGFNDAWRTHFGTDPIEGIQKLAQQGRIEIHPAKGGAIIYLPGEGPGSKKVLDMILE